MSLSSAGVRGEEDIDAQNTRLAGADLADGIRDDRARNRVLADLRETGFIEVDKEDVWRLRAKSGMIDSEVVGEVVDVSKGRKAPSKQNRHRGNGGNHQPITRTF